MVFLFISYLVIIILLICPFNFGIVIFREKKSPNLSLSLNFFTSTKNIEKTGAKSKKKILNISLKDNIFSCLKSLPKPIFDVLKIELLVTENIPYLLYFYLSFFSEYFNRFVLKNNRINDSFFLLSKGNDLYFQVKFVVKFNLFIIFSFLFQIIKVKIRRKDGDN